MDVPAFVCHLGVNFVTGNEAIGEALKHHVAFVVDPCAWQTQNGAGVSVTSANLHLGASGHLHVPDLLDR